MTPFTLDKRDTKDPAHTPAQQAQNERRRLDKNPKRQAALPLSCCLSLSLVLPRSRCPLPVLPLSRAPSLSPVLSRFDSARTSLDKLKNKCERLDKNLVQKSARAPSLSSCLLLSLLLVCCLSRAASRTCALSLVAGRRRWPMGPELESGGALYWLTGLGAREVTVLPARTAIETATMARAAAAIIAAPAPSIAQQSVACPPSPSPSLSLSCAPRVPLPLSLVCPSAWHGRAWRMAKGRRMMEASRQERAHDGQGHAGEARAASGGRARARRMCTGTEPSRSLKTVDPTRVHNKESGCHPL